MLGIITCCGYSIFKHGFTSSIGDVLYYLRLLSILAHKCRRSISLYVTFLMYVHWFYVSIACLSALWWIHRCAHLLPAVSTRLIRALLIAILLLLLLELSEMGLNGSGGLLDLNRAQRRSGWHVRHSTGPVADVGVWAGQDTGYSQRGRGNSHGGIVCSSG